jgi:hypothetical protein
MTPALMNAGSDAKFQAVLPIHPASPPFCTDK